MFLSGCLICAFGASALGAGARAEVAAGQSPRSATSPSELATLYELRLAFGVQSLTRKSETTLRYLPRLFYRPDTFVQERPILLHQVAFGYELRPRRTSFFGVSWDASLGELEQGAVAETRIGESNAAFDAPSFSIFSTNLASSWLEQLSRVTALVFDLQTGYRTSTSVPVLPGLSVSLDSPVPKSFDAGLGAALERRLGRRLDLLVPLHVGYYWSEDIGRLTAVTGELGARYRLSRTTTARASAGATYVSLPPGSIASTPVFPVAAVSMSKLLHRRGEESWTLELAGTHTGAFDTFQGDYRPVFTAAAGTGYIRDKWTIAFSARASVLSSSVIYADDSRSFFGAGLPVTYEISKNFRMQFGARTSFRSRDWPDGPLRPTQVEALGFVNFTAVVSGARDARWVL